MDYAKDFAFLITSYDQTDLVEANIKRIQNEYKTLNNCKIIVVSTHPQDVMRYLEKYKGVIVICFGDAPGNPSVDWKSLSRNGGYISWRHEFLPARIMNSIEKGLKRANHIKAKYLLHLHGDSYYPADKEDKILADIAKIKNATALIDLNANEELPNLAGRYIGKGLHFLPENMLFNVKKCFDIGYGFRFSTIWEDGSKFATHDSGSIEAMLGQFAYFCLTGKNSLKGGDVLDDIFYREFIVREIRDHHSKNGFASGLVNLP